jgi:integrase
MRRGEILKLQWSYVDLARRTLTILGQKNGSRDTLPVKVLQARAAVRTSSTEAVFMNGAGHPQEARNLLRAFYRAMQGGDYAVPLP